MTGSKFKSEVFKKYDELIAEEFCKENPAVSVFSSQSIRETSFQTILESITFPQEVEIDDFVLGVLVGRAARILFERAKADTVARAGIAEEQRKFEEFLASI